jgi:hypothetical protein
MAHRSMVQTDKHHDAHIVLWQRLCTATGIECIDFVEVERERLAIIAKEEAAEAECRG